MVAQFEDPVARAQIAAHIETCDKRDGEFRDSLDRIEKGQDNLWKALTRGREVRFKMLLMAVSFLLMLLVGLIAFIWTSSPAAASHNVPPQAVDEAQGALDSGCGTHPEMVEYMLKQWGAANIWHGLITGTTVRLYQSDTTGVWWTTGEDNKRECLMSTGTAGTKLPFREGITDYIMEFQTWTS